MKLFIFTMYFSFLLFIGNCYAQKKSCIGHFDKELHSYVYDYVDEMPAYPGGLAKFYLFIRKGIKQNTASTKKTKVNLEYVIDTFGNVKSARIAAKAPKDYSKIETSVIQQLSRSPKWKPGKCNSAKAMVKYSITIGIGAN